jgi:hypothetical protein
MDQRLTLDTGDAQSAYDGVTNAMADLAPEAKAKVLGAVTRSQPKATRKQVVQEIQQGPFAGAGPKTVNNLWYLVIAGLFGMTMLGAIFGFVLLLDGKDASASWALAAAGIAGVVGLIAPSPLTTKGGGGTSG